MKNFAIGLTFGLALATAFAFQSTTSQSSSQTQQGSGSSSASGSARASAGGSASGGGSAHAGGSATGMAVGGPAFELRIAMDSNRQTADDMNFQSVRQTISSMNQRGMTIFAGKNLSNPYVFIYFRAKDRKAAENVMAEFKESPSNMVLSEVQLTDMPSTFTGERQVPKNPQ